MTEPQIWTMMGAFVALMFGTLTVIATLFVRVLRAEVGGLRGEMQAEFRAVRAEVGGLRGEMHAEIGGLRGEMHAEIGGLRSEMKADIGGLRSEMKAEIGGLRAEMQAGFARIDGLDRDVQALVKHTFGMDRE